MRKAWVVLGLVLLIGVQFTFLSLFHKVDATGPAFGTTDVCVARCNYDQATVRVAISSGPEGTVSVTLPNGTEVTVNPASTYYVKLGLPRTGDFLGSAWATVGASTISQSSPILASIDANVSSIPFSHPCSQVQGIQNLDVTNIMVVGDAVISLTGYGVAL